MGCRPARPKKIYSCSANWVNVTAPGPRALLFLGTLCQLLVTPRDIQQDLAAFLFKAQRYN